MKQLLLLLTITMATLTANAQAKIYDAFNIKARTTLQLGNKTITEITDDTVMANKSTVNLLTEWATKKAIENVVQGIVGVDTNLLVTRLRLYKVADSLAATASKDTFSVNPTIFFRPHSKRLEVVIPIFTYSYVFIFIISPVSI